MIMKPAIAMPRIEPTTMSARTLKRSRGPEPLSTTADCKKNCMYGEIVVPIKPTTVTRKPVSGENVGTSVPCDDGAPIGFRLDAGNDVTQVDQREDDEDALDDLVAQAQHEQKHDDRGQRDDDVAREVQDLRPRSDAGKLSRRDAGVDEEERGHRDERQADAEVLANQPG